MFLFRFASSSPELDESNAEAAISLQDLPQETLFHLFQYLEPADLCSISLVCKAMVAVAADDHLWQRFLPLQKHDVKRIYVRLMRRQMHKHMKGIPLPWIKARSYVGDLIPRPVQDHKKVIFVGRPGVGKTTLLNSLAGRPYSRQYKATIGADFLCLPTQKGNIQLWDVAGPERFGALVSSYYRQARVVLLMFDLSDPGRSIDSMLDDLRKCREELCPTPSGQPVYFILLGSKLDLVENSTPVESLLDDAKKKCMEIGPLDASFVVSSKDRINIHKVKEKLIELLYGELDEEDEEDKEAMAAAGAVYLPDQQTWLRMAARGGGCNTNTKGSCCLQ